MLSFRNALILNLRGKYIDLRGILSISVQSLQHLMLIFRNALILNLRSKYINLRGKLSISAQSLRHLMLSFRNALLCRLRIQNLRGKYIDLQGILSISAAFKFLLTSTCIMAVPSKNYKDVTVFNISSVSYFFLLQSFSPQYCYSGLPHHAYYCENSFISPCIGF